MLLRSVTLAIFVFLFSTLVIGVIFFVNTKPVGEVAFNQPKDLNNDHSSNAFVLSAAEPDYLPIRDFNIADPEILARAGALYDTHSGKFLYHKDIDKQLPIASLTKLMTAVAIVENLDLNSIITVPVEDLNVDGYGADLVKNEKIKAVDLLKMMLIKSSNDAALVFQTEANALGINLVDIMNDKATELGMSSTRFTNTAGLDDNAFSTVADLVKLVQYVGKHKIIWNILSTSTIDIASIDGRFRHHLINTDQLLGQIPGIIGGKTGYTDKAMGTMILVVDVNWGFSNLIGVILGSNDRFSEVKKLMDWGKIAHRWK